MSAKKLHEQFTTLLEMFTLDKQDAPLVNEALLAFYDSYFEDQRKKALMAQAKITEVEKEIKGIRKRFALGKIDQELYNELAKERESLNSDFASNPIEGSNLQKCVKKVMKFCLNPRLYWETASLTQKLMWQKIVFPDGISLDKQKGGVQTFRINSFFAPIPELVKDLKKTKNEQPIKIDQLSALVTLTGFKPVTAGAEIQCAIQLRHRAILFVTMIIHSNTAKLTVTCDCTRKISTIVLTFIQRIK